MRKNSNQELSAYGEFHLLWSSFCKLLSLSVPMGMLGYIIGVYSGEIEPNNSFPNDIDLGGQEHWRVQAAYLAMLDWVDKNIPEFKEANKKGLH